MNKDRVTVRMEELTLTNTLQLTAIVELLEERGIMTQGDVLERMRVVRDRKRRTRGHFYSDLTFALYSSSIAASRNVLPGGLPYVFAVASP